MYTSFVYRKEIAPFNKLCLSYTYTPVSHTVKSTDRTALHCSIQLALMWMPLDTNHLLKSPCRTSTPPYGTSTPRWHWSPSRTMCSATLHRLLMNYLENVTKKVSWPQNSPDSNLVRHPLGVSGKLRSLDAPSWISLGSYLSRYTHMSSRGCVQYQGVGGRSFESCVLQGGASMDQTRQLLEVFTTANITLFLSGFWVVAGCTVLLGGPP